MMVVVVFAVRFMLKATCGKNDMKCSLLTQHLNKNGKWNVFAHGIMCFVWTLSVTNGCNIVLWMWNVL